MSWFINRIKEPSTWGGVAVLMTLAGVTIPPGMIEALAQFGGGLAAVLAVVMRERAR